eukprot:scaffold153022_cov18-Tisochrysis_lutea.AAC.1
MILLERSRQLQNTTKASGIQKTLEMIMGTNVSGAWLRIINSAWQYRAAYSYLKVTITKQCAQERREKIQGSQSGGDGLYVNVFPTNCPQTLSPVQQLHRLQQLVDGRLINLHARGAMIAALRRLGACRVQADRLGFGWAWLWLWA